MRVFLGVLRVALAITYPFLVYIGLSRGSIRGVGLATATVGLALLAMSLRDVRGENARAILASPIVLLGLGTASALSSDARFVLAMPVLVNAVLFAQFATSLRGTPIVERFARMIDGDLSDAQVAYCRNVTIVWCTFFVANGLIAGALALAGPLDAWTVYTGIVGYVAMGTLGALEYVVRKARFRKFSGHLVDRALRFAIERGRTEAS